LVPAGKQPGLKAGAFSLAWLVPVAETGINVHYKPGLKAFFPPVSDEVQRCSVLSKLAHVYVSGTERSAKRQIFSCG
jgi:hypothetical protein